MLVRNDILPLAVNRNRLGSLRVLRVVWVLTVCWCGADVRLDNLLSRSGWVGGVVNCKDGDGGKHYIRNGWGVTELPVVGPDYCCEVDLVGEENSKF